MTMVRKLARGTRLVVASHNPGKLREIAELIAPYGLEAVSAGSLGVSEPEETEATFAGNARLKALHSARATGLPALSDDSGLEVAALGGEPGIYSARWAGPEKDFGAAMEMVRAALATKGAWDGGVPPHRPAATSPSGGEEKGGGELGPRANFTAALCLAWPDGETAVFEGKVFGHLVWPPRGTKGFGYDPMFVPDDEGLTFGEMEPPIKHGMSHRARAFRLFVEACLE